MTQPYIGGWIKDLPDARDYRCTSTLQATLPLKVDLRTTYQTEIYDQGNLGSCTANAVAALYNTLRLIQGLEPYPPSRLFIYYNTRVIQNTVKYDSGASIRNTMKAASQPFVRCRKNCPRGCPAEVLWPYDITKYKRKPSAVAYANGKDHYLITYERVNQNLLAIKTALAANKPIVLGFAVYSSFLTIGSDGIMPIPNIDTETLLGGHAVLIVGYDDTMRSFIMQNSWGTSFGDQGYFYGPYDYFTNSNYASDFWTATKIT
ncbi:MAG: hypothetical protein RLZ12_598 [Bacillota bacterium]|jgi:C1A family cysteine protease